MRPGAIIVVHDRWHTAATLQKALPCILKSGDCSTRVPRHGSPNRVQIVILEEYLDGPVLMMSGICCICMHGIHVYVAFSTWSCIDPPVVGCISPSFCFESYNWSSYVTDFDDWGVQAQYLVGDISHERRQ